ncbi:Mediator of RNA polymerase II transcription subunit 31 [Exophiala xenobiotica]|nr:Mediator of RNA polymerase II transcription subunit 31 [Exophiala xenobiotica]
MDATTPPTTLSHRFTLELEFVLCLSNPHYLQYLAVNYPHLLNKPAASHNNSDFEDSDAARFARYLKYLYGYWRTPQYAKYLTHPGATLRNLELLQQEQFRKDMIRPDVIAKLFETESRAKLLADGIAVDVQRPSNESLASSF